MQSVYLDNTLGFHTNQDGNLKTITQQFDDGKRSLSTISAILASLGIPEDKVKFAIANYTREGQAMHGGECTGDGPGFNKYKKNQHNMQFNLKNLAEILGGLKTILLGIKESNVSKINYSANSSYNIVNSVLREIHDLEQISEKLNESKDDIEASALIKESVHPATFISKPEYYLLNKSHNLLKQYDDIVAIKEFIEKSEYLLKEGFYTNYISNMIYEMLDLSEHAFYSDAIDDMKYLLKNDEKYIKENVTVMLNKHSWIPKVQGLLNFNSKETQKLSSNNNAIVEKVFSPIHQNEDGSYIFRLDEHFYQINKDKTLQKVTDVRALDKRFVALTEISKNVKIDENKIILYKNDKSLKLVFEDNKIKINDVEKEITDFEGVKNILIGSAFFRLDEMSQVNNVLLLIENVNTIKEIDVIDRVIGHNGNIVNIIKLSESNIYINRVNPQVLVNELFKADNANQAQQIVNEYIEFDISNSIFDILETDNKGRVVINEKIKMHEGRVEFLNKELKKVEEANKELNNSKLLEAIKLLKDELRKEEVEVQNLYEEKAKLS